MTDYPILKLQVKKETPIVAGHPWIFSRALQKEENLEPGSLVRIFSYHGDFLGIGTFNPLTAIRVRMLTRGEDVTVDEEFFVRRFLELDREKKLLIPARTTGYRLVHADADYLPGLIVDRYDAVLVFQIHTAGMDRLRTVIVKALDQAFHPAAIVERSDISVRKHEGLTVMPVKVHMGQIEGVVDFQENGLEFLADPLKGQKTGFFLDQRDARQKVRTLVAGKKVLNLFGYTGAFSVYAAKGDASKIVTVDVSTEALNLAKKQFVLNNFSLDDHRFEFIVADVFDFLSGKQALSQQFDMIICDPPAFAKSSAKLNQAMRAYVSLNERCLRLLSKGGLFVTSSCSGRVSAEDFRSALRLAAGIARKDLRVLDFIEQPLDHTEKLSFPEGRYLKTVFLMVL